MLYLKCIARNPSMVRLSTPALPATRPSQEDDASYASGSMC